MRLPLQVVAATLAIACAILCPARSLAAPPVVTVSYYIDLAPSEFATYGEYLAAYRRIGCMEARYARGGLVMLDFGESRYSKPAHEWGHNAWSPVHVPPEGLGPWMTDRDMERAILAFALGLRTCARPGDFYLLALGVNNNNYEPVSMLTAGKVWGRLVQAVDADLIAAGANHAAWAIGAIDAEAGFGSVRDTVDWIRGYNQATAMSRYAPLLDFGDLECSFNHTPPSCGSGWTLYWHYWVAWGNGHAYPLPEIYGTYDRADRLDDAAKWRRLADFAIARSGGFAYAGIIAEQQVPPRHYDVFYAMRRLEEAHRDEPRAKIAPLATNITWCLLDDATRGARHDVWCSYDGLLQLGAPAARARPFSARDAMPLFARGRR